MTMKWKTKEVVVTAMIGAVIGILYTVMDYMYTPLVSLLGPIFMELTFGIYLLSAALPMYIMRKPGFAFFGALVTAGVNLALGSPYGIQLILAGVLQAVGIEIGYAIGKYKGGFVSIAIGSVLGALCVLARDYLVFGYSQYSGTVVFGMVCVRLLSAVIIGMLLTKGISAALKKAGVIRSFRVSQAA